MANDRILLKCKYCGEDRMLFKYWPDPNRAYVEAKGLEEFMNKHIFECHPKGYAFDLNGDPGFVLETENYSDAEIAEMEKSKKGK